MGRTQQRRLAALAGLGAGILLTFVAWAPTGHAQGSRDRERWRDPQFWNTPQDRLTTIEPGTFIQVRTNQRIESNRTDNRVFPGVVEQDVWDDYSRLAVPAIPRGSRVDLIVRTSRDNDLVLDLASIYAHGQRYEIDAAPERVEATGGRVRGDDVAPLAGGGAIVGTIIGALTGGGKGAAIGAAAGASAGLAIAYRGKSVRVPADSVLTFRLDRGLRISVPDGPGRNRDRR